jgi:hypothetical protein
MTTSVGHFTEPRWKSPPATLMLKGGGPLVVLHGVEGHGAGSPSMRPWPSTCMPQRIPAMARPTPTWMETIAHQAVFYQWFYRKPAWRG